MPAEFDQYADDYDKLLGNRARQAFASNQDFFVERKLHLLLAYFRRRNRDTKQLSWVDIGCGRGELLRMGQGQFGRIAGCDLSAGMLAGCQDLAVELQRSPGELPFADSSFDVATAVCVYHHVEKGLRARLTAEAYRVLKPGGVFALIEHNPLNPMTQLIVRSTPVDADAELLTAGTARRVAAGAGFRVDRTEYFLWLPAAVYRRAGAIEGWFRRVPLGGQYAMFAEKVRAGAT